MCALCLSFCLIDNVKHTPNSAASCIAEHVIWINEIYKPGFMYAKSSAASAKLTVDLRLHSNSSTPAAVMWISLVLGDNWIYEQVIEAVANVWRHRLWYHVQHSVFSSLFGYIKFDGEYCVEFSKI